MGRDGWRGTSVHDGVLYACLLAADAAVPWRRSTASATPRCTLAAPCCLSVNSDNAGGAALHNLLFKGRCDAQPCNSSVTLRTFASGYSYTLCLYRMCRA